MPFGRDYKPMNWKEEFKNRYVGDNILDCIPKKNWKEMELEVFSFIQSLLDKQKQEYKEQTIKWLKDLRARNCF
jgi:hypothetical protein